MQDQEDCDGLSEHSESSLFICEIQLFTNNVFTKETQQFI